jgi:methylase of polypeptide subunit release factors
VLALQAVRVFAVDKSPVAAAYARANIADAGLSQYVTVLEGSWYEPVCSHLLQPSQQTTATSQASHPGRRLGGILSNPPYIPQAVMDAGLQAEVGRHEPWSALNGGPGPGMDSLSVSAVSGRCRQHLHDRSRGHTGYEGVSSCSWAMFDQLSLSQLQVICAEAVDLLAPNGFLALEVTLPHNANLLTEHAMLDRLASAAHTN